MTCASGQDSAQDSARVRTQGSVFTDTLDVAATQPFRLRPFIIPESVTLIADSMVVPPSDYSLNDRHGHLWYRGAADSVQSLIVTYRALPVTFKDSYKNSFVKDREEADSTGFFTSVPGAIPDEDDRDYLGSSKLNRSGSISRGVIAGNNRDVTIESGLRMQLSGEVVEGVNIRAALTDENTPILPEGTTQRLQELDKVFIEISTERAVATLGDFQLDLDGSTFGQFSRKLQGVSLSGGLPVSDGIFAGGNASFAGATSRGIFRSQPIQILEGVQGPYRLEGQFGERFIILVPGSEVVYLDGIRLTRGERNDYVIDYATAEVTFTARRIIGADRRVVVEFQYSTNQFTRTLLASEAETDFWNITGTKRSRGKFGVTVLREADSRQFAEEFGLTSTDSLLLANAGDNLASRSGAELVQYDPEALFVQYRREIVDEGLFQDTIFVAIDQQPADTVDVYRVQFSRVGIGFGDYARRAQLVNGIQYEYVGRGLGEYAPIRVLPRPKKQQLVDLYGTIEPIRGIQISGEFAQSQNDLNRLSILDSEDDQGTALTGSIKVVPLKVNAGETYLGAISAELTRTKRSANFVTFNRTRDVEFGRVWNLASTNSNPVGAVIEGNSDTVIEGRVLYKYADSTFVQAGFGQLDVGSLISSERFSLESSIAPSRYPSAHYRLENISTDNLLADQIGSWLRQKGTIRKNLRGVVPSLDVEHERRELRAVTGDSLLGTSFEFFEVRPGVRRTSDKYSIGGTVEFRQDSYPLFGDLHEGGTSWTIQTNTAVKPSQNFDADLVFGFRSVSVKDAFRINLQKENQKSVVLRTSGSTRQLSRAVRASWVYDARTERTPRLQEIYIRTGPELGQYVWVDANGDNVVQVDEFILETTPNEGNYVKSFIPSDSLFSIIGLQTRARLDVDPSRIIKGSGSLAAVAQSISTRTIVDITEKNSTDRLTDIYLLRLHAFRDPDQTLSGRLSIRQDVFLFKNKRAYGGEITFNQIRSLNNLAAGLETKFVNRWQTSWTTSLGEHWSTRLTGALDTDRAANTSFESRNFDIRSREISPEVSYAPSRSLQLNVRPEYALKKDTPRNRQSEVFKLPVEIRFTKPARYQLFSILEVADVSLAGDATGLAGFELTDGRGEGRSYLWSLNGQYTINQHLRAVVSYDGRAPADTRTIHTVRMQLSAVF